MSGIGRLCCKSPKLPGDDFLTVRRSDRRTPVCAASITLPRSPVSLSSGDEVPHIFTRKSRLRPGEFLITSAKRLLQQYRPKADIDRTEIPQRSTPLPYRVVLSFRVAASPHANVVQQNSLRHHGCQNGLLTSRHRSVRES